MIGQKKNLDMIVKWRMNRAFPRFIIIEGDYGSGRLTLAKEIVKTLGATGIISSNGIDAVREVITNSYCATEPTVYIFRDTDDMSIAAKNSMLKVVEEPPNSAYFIMTVKSLTNTLDTIKSRASVIKMQPYSREELNLVDIDSKLHKYIYTINDTIKEHITALDEAKTLSDRVITELNNKSCGGVLRELTNLKAKSTDTDKIEPAIFMKVFRNDINNIDIKNLEVGRYVASLVAECDNELKRDSISKKSAIEVMMVNIVVLLKEM